VATHIGLNTHHYIQEIIRLFYTNRLGSANRAHPDLTETCRQCRHHRDFSEAFVSDDLSDALDYATLSRRVKQYCQQSRFHLLEALCGGILKLVFVEFPVQSVRLVIRKPHALRDAIPSIECYRVREQMGIRWTAEKESA
jgi:FolB domain-containing protein